MKRLMIALLSISLALILGLAPVLAEETAANTFIGGVRFGMTMDEVMGKMNLPNPETDSRRMRGPAEFDELEYENVTAENGRRADIKFFFAGNALVAFCTDYQDGTDYEAVKADLVGLYGAAVPFSAEKLGNARFVIDDDGELDDCREMIEAEGLLIVLERDDDGDVDVTCLDTTAPYINN